MIIQDHSVIKALIKNKTCACEIDELKLKYTSTTNCHKNKIYAYET